MPIEILMPALSPTMTEGNLAKWLKNEGDSVKSGDVIAEIETDKATMEVEAVDEGVIAKIVVPAGSHGIKVNALIAVLLEDGETQDAVQSFISSKSGGTSAPVSAPAATSAATSAPVTPPHSAPTAAPTLEQHQRISPLAKRLAAAFNVNPQTIKGTGPNGRIVRADVEKAKATPQANPSASSTPAAPIQGVNAYAYADGHKMAYDALPNTTMRKVIASRLSQSKQTAPHFYLTVDCELDTLLALRKKMNQATESRISVNDFIIRATALAMRKVPAANASWMDDAILQYRDVDVSVAVASPAGLITPIVKKADTKSLSEISTEMKDLVARARDGKLKPDEFQGGGFTISNLGMFGIKDFSAIINPPQSCILAIGAGEERAVVKSGQIVVAHVMTCTLSVDHRSVDGSVGAKFLSTFKEMIQNPYTLLV